MRTLLILALAFALSAQLAGSASCGETAEQKKAHRILYLDQEIKGCPSAIAKAEKQIKEGKDAKEPRWVAEGENLLRYKKAWLASATVELAWLKGELTAKIAEEKVKAGTEAVKKAEEAKDQPAADKAKADLASATAVLELVKKLDASGEF